MRVSAGTDGTKPPTQRTQHAAAGTANADAARGELANGGIVVAEDAKHTAQAEMQARARTAPPLDMAFGIYFRESDGLKWHTWVNRTPQLFRAALVDALTNPRTERLFLAVDGVWLELPLG